MFKQVLGVLLLVFICTGLKAQEPVLLESPHPIKRVDQVAFFVDSTQALTFADISTAEVQAQFQMTSGNLRFGYSPDAIWLRIVSSNTIPDRQWYLEIPAPFLEFVDFYQQQTTGWEHSVSGYYRPQSVRKISHTGHVLPLVFNHANISTVYVRIAGSSPKTFPVQVVEKDRFISKSRYEDVGYGLFFGILIVMFFYNLIIFLTLRQGNYLLYICTIVCTFFIFASASGYAGKFLWPENPELNFYFGRMPLGVLTIFLAIFTIRFLEVRTYSRYMYYSLLSLIPLSVIAAVLVATDGLPSAGNNLISISTIVYLTTGIVCRVKGNQNANFFIAAWTVYLVGGLLLTLRNSGVLESNFWTTHFVEIGAALETTLIAFALADQYRKLKQEKEQAQALALRIQQEANELLEQKVIERTEQLSRINEELSTTLETVRQQSRVIENKNAELDGFFYRISHDLKGPISSLQGLYNLARIEVKDESALSYIERKHQQVQRLHTIINGLIHLTKLSDNTLTKERIDFTKMIDECIGSFQGLEGKNKIVFSKEIEANIAFDSEWTLLNAILQNLIENAIKYSRPESPFVRIKVTQDTDGVCIVVHDNGKGIPAEHQSKIFEMFYRATHDAPGTGLGLYILKRSVDRLGGAVTVQSEEGVGSTFIVTLPAAS